MHTPGTFNQLHIVRSGGFAGAEESVLLAADGALTVTAWMRAPRTMHLPAEGLQRLVATVMDAVLAAEAPPAGDSAAHPDRYQYDGVVEYGAQSIDIHVQGAPSAAMQPLIAMIDRLIDTTP